MQLGDETFIAVAPPVVAAVVADPARWAAWWPDLELEVTRDRGPKGQQWALTGAVGGTAEIYLEPWHDGTLVHLFLRLRQPWEAKAARKRALAWKSSVTALKDELEGDRGPGTAAQVQPGT